MKEIMLTSKAYDGRYMEVVCQQIANPEENTSEIRWTLTVKGGSDPYYSTGPTTLMIDGQPVYYSKRKSYTTHAFPTGKGSVSGSLTVPHDEFGHCQVEVYLKTAIFTETLLVVSKVWQLEDIQRASQIRASDAFIGSCATVVVGRGSSSFTHTIAYAFGNRKGWLNALGDPVAAPVRHGETTLNFRLPEDFYQEIPDRPRDSCLLTCTTYHGEQVIGESQCSFTVTADPMLCAPVVSGTVTPGDLRTLELTDGRLIPGISTAYCLVDAAAQQGATLISLTAGEVAVEAREARLERWSLPTVPVVAIDSRGYQTRLELPCQYVPYVELTNLSEVARRSPTADSAVLTLRGVAFAGNFGQKDNALTAIVEFAGRQLTVPVEIQEDGSYLQQVTLEQLSYTHSYPVTVTVVDKAMAVERQLTVRKGIPVFDWGESDFSFHVPVEVPELTLNGIPLETYIRNLLT